jgi:hypothetical protein
LTASTKAQIVAEADARIKVLKSQKDAARQSYQGVVERRGLDPRNVFIGEPDVIDFNSLPTGK